MANPARAVTNQSRSTTNTICSSILRTVCLHDWWLIKAKMDSKGARLGVGGFASREGQGIRAFQSAAIVKRHDTVTLETVDGITVTLSGFINRSLTHENGFPPEVCNPFLFGFPYYWEEYIDQYFSEECTNKAVPSRISNFQGINMPTSDEANSFLPVSLDDLPVTRIRDLLMYSLGDSENGVLTKNIFYDMLQTYSGSAFEHDGSSIHSNKDSNCPIMTGDYVPDETPSTRKKPKVEQKSRGGNSTLHATDMGEEEFQKSIRRSKIGPISSGKGVATRSMTRLRNASNKLEENLSCNTSVKCGRNEPISPSKAYVNQFGGIVVARRNASNVSHATIVSREEMEASTGRSSRVKTLENSLFNECRVLFTRRNGSNVCHQNILSEKEVEVKETPKRTAVRRSERLRNLKK